MSKSKNNITNLEKDTAIQGNTKEIDNSSEKEKLRPTSFRLNDDVITKFKEIASTLKTNQSETMKILLQTYELQSHKAGMTIRKKLDIEKFERHIESLTRLYLSSLDDNEAVQDGVREEFKTELQSKDNTIKDYQKNLTELIKREKEAVDLQKKLNDKIASLEKNLEEHKNRITELTDNLSLKNDLINNLKNEIAEHKQKMENYQILDDELSKTKSELNSLRQQEKELKLQYDKEILKIQKEYQEKQYKESQEHQKQIHELQEQVNKYQTQCINVLKDFEAKFEQQNYNKTKDKKYAGNKNIKNIPNKN